MSFLWRRLFVGLLVPFLWKRFRDRRRTQQASSRSGGTAPNPLEAR